MKPADLQRWMNKHGKNVVAVAAMANVDTKTVKRFLDGETDPRPIVLDAFKRLVSESEETPPKTA